MPRKTGDVILEVNGKRVNDPNELRNTVAAMSPGTEVTVTIAREGAEQQVKVRLAELDVDSAQAGGGGGQPGGTALGIGVVPLTPELASELGLRRGIQGVVIQSIDPGSPADEAGLQTGDVIQEVNRQPVKTVAGFTAALQQSGARPALVLVKRRSNVIYVTLKPNS